MTQEVFIENLSHDGRGIARLNGKAIFVAGALPGESVTIAITHRHKHYDEATVQQILQPATNRVIPRCAHYQTCGGCVLQHLDEKAQLSAKELAFWETLKRIGHVEPQEKLPALEGGSWQYRHRARLHVQVKNKKIAMGYKSKLDPRTVTHINHCPILMPALVNLLPALNQVLNALSAPSSIEQILFAYGKEGVGVLFQTRTLLAPDDLSLLTQFGKDHYCYVTTARGHAVHHLHEIPTLTYPFPHLSHTLKFSLTDFTQVNVEMNELMLEATIEMMSLTKQDSVADLFSGLGNFSLLIAPHVKQVYGAEFSLEMVQAAKRNAMINNLSNLHFDALDLEDPETVTSFLKRHHINKIIIDPPRAGARTLVEGLSKKNVQGILYVSCHPGSFARDAKILVHEKKYTLKSARVINMFPHTGHLETMAWFES